MALLLGTISGRLGSTQWIYALNGIVLGLSVFFVGYRVGLARFYAMAMVSALIGFAIALSGWPDAISNLLYFALFGLAWIASGALTLRHYLSSTQPASEDESV